MPDYTIRNLWNKDEIAPIESLQGDIWGYGKDPNAPPPYPTRCLFEFAESGGLVAAAYSNEAEMVAFSASWIGRERSEERRLYLHSQLLGVKENSRDAGIGMQLKLNQREFALDKDLHLVKWTFDPLQSRNAYLNLRKLGGVVRKFIPDYYGNLGGILNQHFPTDRFWVEWHVDSPRVHNRLDHISRKAGYGDVRAVSSDYPIVNTVTGPRDRRRCLSVDVHRCEPYLLVEIPFNISELRMEDPDLAEQWQDACRDIFGSYLSRYLVIDFIRRREAEYYLLATDSMTLVLNADEASSSCGLVE